MHLFHLVAPIIAQERNYFRDVGAGDCEFVYSGSGGKTIEGMPERIYEVGLDSKPYLMCEPRKRRSAKMPNSISGYCGNISKRKMTFCSEWLTKSFLTVNKGNC